MTSVRRVLLTSVFLSLTACVASKPETTHCTPGTQATCECGDGGGTGHETCESSGDGYGACLCGPELTCADGGTFGACQCGDGGPGLASCLPDGGEAACACGEICVPDSVTACSCGDGGVGEQTCNPAGTTLGACLCGGPPACTASALTATGTLTTSVGIVDYTGTTVNATLQEFLGAAPAGGGCLATATFSLALAAGGCPLQLQFGEVEAGSGGLTQATLNVDTACGALMGVPPGTYSSIAGYGLIPLTATPPIPEAIASAICLTDETLSFGSADFTLTNGTGGTLDVNLGSLSLSGDLYSTGSSSAQCYATATCGPDYSGAAPPWCSPSGTCPNGDHNGGTGQCVPDGTCDAGFHDGGDGMTCLPDGECIPGQHDGGNGTCVVNGSCASGYQDGGDGSCVVDGSCAPGYHDGGNGSCVAEGSCATGYQDGGNGTCEPAGQCSHGFHDGGAGTCVADGTCSPNYYLDQEGNCGSGMSCPANQHDGGNGTCVADGQCSTGFQNGGDGSCVASNTCAPGYVLIFGNCTQAMGCFTGQPTATASASQMGSVGQKVTLDGSQSMAPPAGTAGVAIWTWSWSSRPAASSAILTTTAGSTATFVPDVVGSYVVGLVVTNYTGCSSQPTTVTIAVP